MEQGALPPLLAEADKFGGCKQGFGDRLADDRV